MVPSRYGSIARNKNNSVQRTWSVPYLFDLPAVVRQAFPAAALLYGRHTANNSSSAVLTLDHGVIAFFETRQPDISHDLRLHIADIALRELIVCRIVRIFDQLGLRNPRPEACTFDIPTGQIRFHPLGVIVGLGFVGLFYPLLEGRFGVATATMCLSSKPCKTQTNRAKRYSQNLLHSWILLSFKFLCIGATWTLS